MTFTSPMGRGRIAPGDAEASSSAIRVRGFGLEQGSGTVQSQSKAAADNAETRLWQALRGRRLAHYKFRRQHPVDRYIVDFVALDAKLIIEVDGATHSTDAELAYDSERAYALESFGFYVMRVSNLDVYDNLDGVLEMICNTLEIGENVPPHPPR
jgi:very-short-patch-repair endonuclease